MKGAPQARLCVNAHPGKFPRLYRSRQLLQMHALFLYADGTCSSRPAGNASILHQQSPMRCSDRLPHWLCLPHSGQAAGFTSPPISPHPFLSSRIARYHRYTLGRSSPLQAAILSLSSTCHTIFCNYFRIRHVTIEQ